MARTTEWLWAYWAFCMLVALSIGVTALILTPRQADVPDEPLLTVNDKPLLTNAQKAEARATGSTAVVIGGEHIVINNIPEDYI